MDDCILEILKYLNFNDKSSCRLVCHQFRYLVDSLPISKLVVFDRSPLQPGKFALIDEEYGLQDCVYVYNLKTFFANKFILQRLDKIEKLVINGLDKQEFSLNSAFKKLTHLELREAHIINPTILGSPNIKTLFLKDTHLNKTHEDYFNGVLGFNNLKCKLKHFSHSTILRTEIEFYQSCFKKDAFSELEILDCYLDELKTLLFIGNTFTKLKTINVRIAKSRDDFIDFLNHNALGKLVRKLRSDLKVNLFGIPLNKSTHKVITDFICDLSSKLSFTSGRMSVLISNDLIEFEDEHPHLLDGFFKQIDTIRFQPRLADQSLYDKFTNVSEACYNFWYEVRYDLPERFKAHPNITSLIITCFRGHYLNDIIDMIPVSFKNLTNLRMEQWDYVNFDFLLKLPKLKTLTLLLRFEFDQSLFIEILRTLKHLSFFQILYERTDVHTKDQLSSFKKLVLACLSNELRFTDCVFKVELHNRTSYMGNEKFPFVRYILKRTQRDSEENSLTVCENVISKMTFIICCKHYNAFID